MNNIVYDNVIFELQRSGGISVVWYELLKRMMQATTNIKFIDNGAGQNFIRQTLHIPDQQRVGRICCPQLARALPVSVAAHEPFIFHSSYYRYCTHPLAINITTLHDFTNELFSTGLKKHLHTWQKYRALRHSDHIVCISEHTKKDLLNRLPDVDASRVSVIYNGVSPDYHMQADDEAATTETLPFPPRSYVLFVGNRAKYKNFDVVIQGLVQTSHNLLIAGPALTEAEKRSIERLLPPDRYKSLGYVSNEQLNTLYNHAFCFAYPSSYEGFGIPVLEAQAAGCPVIACNATSIPEVIGTTPLLMEQPTVHAFIEKLRLLDTPDVHADVRRLGLENVRRFSWDNTFKAYLQLYIGISR